MAPQGKFNRRPQKEIDRKHKECWDRILSIDCKDKVKKNLIKVDTGGALTEPLSKLDKKCDFKKKWRKHANLDKIEEEEFKAKRKKYMKEYHSRNR